MKLLLILICFLCLNGCTVTSGFTIGASAASSIFDRYEKYKIERRLKELEKEIQRDINPNYVDLNYSHRNVNYDHRSRRSY
tara:strand:+ start:534 stop:776 length:243 start_codon:yes stop_codon:yes gene_type:complete